MSQQTWSSRQSDCVSHSLKQKACPPPTSPQTFWSPPQSAELEHPEVQSDSPACEKQVGLAPSVQSASLPQLVLMAPGEGGVPVEVSVPVSAPVSVPASEPASEPASVPVSPPPAGARQVGASPSGRQLPTPPMSQHS
jgi:hypothetical protein